jgi:hypothetical protein
MNICFMLLQYDDVNYVKLLKYDTAKFYSKL